MKIYCPDIATFTMDFVSGHKQKLKQLRNKDQEYNNPLASFATCFSRQRIGHE